MFIEVKATTGRVHTLNVNKIHDISPHESGTLLRGFNIDMVINELYENFITRLHAIESIKRLN